MPQVLKREVRERILVAALHVFAAHGYLGASMATIAARAELATASLYRYYASKDELFDAVVAPEVAQRFASLLDRRVRALAQAALGDAAPGDDAHGEEMLRFWMEHRLVVVILLDRAAGTAYARYGERFVEDLVEGTLAHIAAAHPGAQVSAPARFVLTRIFEHTRRMLAAILEEHESPAAMREAIEAFWSYQIAGLRAFALWIRSHQLP